MIISVTEICRYWLNEPSAGEFLSQEISSYSFLYCFKQYFIFSDAFALWRQNAGAFIFLRKSFHAFRSISYIFTLLLCQASSLYVSASTFLPQRIYFISFSEHLPENITSRHEIRHYSFLIASDIEFLREPQDSFFILRSSSLHKLFSSMII